MRRLHVVTRLLKGKAPQKIVADSSEHETFGCGRSDSVATVTIEEDIVDSQIVAGQDEPTLCELTAQLHIRTVQEREENSKAMCGAKSNLLAAEQKASWNKSDVVQLQADLLKEKKDRADTMVRQEISRKAMQEKLDIANAEKAKAQEMLLEEKLKGSRQHRTRKYFKGTLKSWATGAGLGQARIDKMPANAIVFSDMGVFYSENLEAQVKEDVAAFMQANAGQDQTNGLSTEQLNAKRHKLEVALGRLSVQRAITRLSATNVLLFLSSTGKYFRVVAAEGRAEELMAEVIANNLSLSGPEDLKDWTMYSKSISNNPELVFAFRIDGELALLNIKMGAEVTFGGEAATSTATTTDNTATPAATANTATSTTAATTATTAVGVFQHPPKAPSSASRMYRSGLEIDFFCCPPRVVMCQRPSNIPPAVSEGCPTHATGTNLGAIEKTQTDMTADDEFFDKLVIFNACYPCYCMEHFLGKFPCKININTDLTGIDRVALKTVKIKHGVSNIRDLLEIQKKKQDGESFQWAFQGRRAVEK
jgi:hypothetical protein